MNANEWNMINSALEYRLFVQRFSNALGSARRMLIATHANPDGDALASIASCMNVFSKRVPQCSCFAEGYAGEYLKHFPFLDRVVVSSRDLDVHSFDLVLLVDAHSTKRASLPLLNDHDRSFAVDHHPLENHADVKHMWVDVEYPSASAMLAVLFRDLGERIDALTANMLLCGIVTDTELFKNHSANHLAYRIAGELISAGADLSTMKRFGLNAVGFDTVKTMGTVLERIQASERYHAGVVVLDERSKSKEVLTSVVKQARLPETMFVLKSKSSGGRIEVSMRSYNKNVGLLARLCGGGGHPRAAAFRVSGRVVEQDGKITIM